MSKNNSEVSSPQWKNHLNHHDTVSYLRRTRKRRLISGILGIYIAFIGVFGYSYYNENNISYAAEPAVLNFSTSKIAKSKNKYNFNVLVKNTSEKELAKNIEITLSSVSKFTLLATHNQEYMVKGNNIYIKSLSSFQASEYKITFESDNIQQMNIKINYLSLDKKNSVFRDLEFKK